MVALKGAPGRERSMTTLAVLADPPREGLVLPRLAGTSPLSPAEATDLYAAMLKDTFRAVARSGGELLVNYRPDELLPEEFRTDERPEAEVRALAADALDDLDDVRFEKQVGSTFDARAGNTATHLLDGEDVASVAVIEGDTPFLARKDIDSAAMKLRSSEVVLGPAEGGRVYFLGLTDALDFDGAYTPPELETLAHRGADAGHAIDFLPTLTKVETGRDLVSLVTTTNARKTAGRIVPEFTATFLDDLGLHVDVRDGERTLVRD